MPGHQDVATEARFLNVLRHDLAGARVRARVDVDRPEIVVVDVLESHRHDLGPAVDRDMAEEL